MKNVQDFRFEKGNSNAKASAYMKKSMYDAKEVERLMEEYAKQKAIDFAKWHDKTDVLREKPTKWIELYNDYSNGHIF
jgi:CelD/BcsL family acetyltransferase involved in cellulose biosynthesis